MRYGIPQILCIIGIILFTSLSVLGATAHTLWTDETGTAIYAESILTHGMPLGWDGVNVTAHDGTLSMTRGFIINQVSWLPLYIAAAAFRILGSSSFAARLPFIIATCIGLLFVYRLGYQLFRNRVAGALGVWFLAVSVPFLLFSFQATYYPLVFLGVAMMVSGDVDLSVGKRGGAVWILSGGMMLYYSSPVIAFVFSAASVTAIWWCLKSGKHIWAILLLNALAFVSFIPWVLLFSSRPNQVSIAFANIGTIPEKFFPAFVTFVTSLNASAFVPVGLVLLVMWQWRNFTEIEKEGIRLFTVMTGLYVIFVLFLNPLISHDQTFGFLTQVRFHTWLFTVSALVTAVSLAAALRSSRRLGGMVAILVMGTGLLTFSPRIYLYDYLSEAFRPYALPQEAVATYLKTHAKQGDTIFINLDRYHAPLLFLTGDRYHFINRIHPGDRLVFPEYTSVLPTYTYLYRGAPEWVILFSLHPETEFDYRGVFPKGLYPDVNLDTMYEKPMIYPIYFLDRSVPELSEHSFAPVTPSYADEIFIFHKKSL